MAVGADWNPGAYAVFRDVRLRPAQDLLAQVPDLPPGDIIDLGCGAGAAAPSLAARFAGRRLVGVDASAAMLKEAGKSGLYTRLDQADIHDWLPDGAVALIFSNAALHWLGDHSRVIPRLAGCMVPGGVIAIQMPRNFHAPSHHLLRDIAASMFPDRFDMTGWVAPVDPPAVYWQMLAPLGELLVWETEYLQHLSGKPGCHPVRAFTESTAMRPYLAKLAPSEATAFASAYDAALPSAYPIMPDGRALLAFRRLFLVLRRPA